MGLRDFGKNKRFPFGKVYKRQSKVFMRMKQSNVISSSFEAFHAVHRHIMTSVRSSEAAIAAVLPGARTDDPALHRFVLQQ